MTTQLGSFNAGNSIGYPPNPNVTGPMYVGAVSGSASAIHLPAGWTVIRTPGQATGWYRITHMLNSSLYFVVGSTRSSPKVTAEPSNYTSNFFDVNTAQLPSGNDLDADFTFFMVNQPPN